MSVINGLKNLEDFRGEITLLNIENSPGPNHRKRRIFQFLSVLKQQKLKKTELCLIVVSIVWRGSSCKLGNWEKGGKIWKEPGKLKLKAVAAAGEEYVSKSHYWGQPLNSKSQYQGRPLNSINWILIVDAHWWGCQCSESSGIRNKLISNLSTFLVTDEMVTVHRYGLSLMTTSAWWWFTMIKNWYKVMMRWNSHIWRWLSTVEVWQKSDLEGV